MYIEIIPVKIARNPSFTENCYLVSSSSESNSVIAIDPGDEAELILKLIGDRDLAAVILTHGHYDHLGALTELSQVSDASFYIHEYDAAYIAKCNEITRSRFILFGKEINPANRDRVDPNTSAEALVFNDNLQEGVLLELCGIRLLVMHTPGHSAGSICLYSAEEGILFSGDTLFKGTCGRCDLGGNPLQMHDSLARLRALPPETVVLPGHEGTTTIGEEIHRGLSEY